jgi:glycosyl transferase family 25
MKTYVINLDRSPERLAHMQSILRAARIDFTRLAAVDGTALAPDEIAAAEATLSAPEIACFLSHRRAWQMIAADPAAFGAVLEDDIHIAPSLPVLLAGDGWIPAGADVVKLETMMRPVYLDRAAVPAPAGHALHRLRSTHAGTAGYIISRDAAARLVARHQHAGRTVDAYLFELPDGAARGLNVYQLDPSACIQDDRLSSDTHRSALASTIHTDRKNARRAATGIVARVVREIGRGVERLTEVQRTLSAGRRGEVRRRVPFAERAIR